MDKIKVNNQVVLMRKHVKQAKLYTINKLTKLVKTYQSKKGTDDQKLKNERKVKRLFEKIAILKKTKPDSVSRMALSKAKDWNAILAQKNAPLEDLCLAMLANSSEVQKEVEKFSTSESSLMQKIPELIQEWEIKNLNPDNKNLKNMKASDIKRRKLEKISNRKKSQFKGASFPNNVKIPHKSHVVDNGKQKIPPSVTSDDENNQMTPLETEISDDGNGGNQMSPLPEIETSYNENFSMAKNSENNTLKQVDKKKLKNKLTRNNLKTPKSRLKATASLDIQMEEENKNTNGMIGCHGDISPGKIPEVNSIDLKNVNNKNKENKLLKGSQELTSKGNIQNNSSISSDSNQSIIKRLNAIAASDAKVISKKNKSNSSKTVTAFDLNSLKNSTEIPVKNLSPEDDESHDLPSTHKKDSFFLTGDGNDSDGDDLQKGDEHPFRHKPNFRRDNYQKEYKGNHFKDGDFSNRKRKFQDEDFSFNKNRGRQNNFRNKSFLPNKEHFKQENNRDFRLPSRMNKNNRFKSDSHLIKESKSTNINNSGLVKDIRNNNFKKDFQKQKQSPDKNEGKANLHPSWEAKRKMKESLKSGAKGKRIVFDD